MPTGEAQAAEREAQQKAKALAEVQQKAKGEALANSKPGTT